MAMELRLMSDEAEDKHMIDAIKNGRDLHQEVADMAGVKRSLAKNGRFARQYGGGIDRVALTLGVNRSVAESICKALAKQAPRNDAYSKELIAFAQTHGVGYDFLGRRFFFDRGFEYKMPNYRIQGGCAEILKMAIREIAEIKFNNKLSGMILPIHDEIVLNLHESDLGFIPQIKRIMETVYRPKHLPLEVSVSIGPNMHDLETLKNA
tara:strand:+ start:34 stop:657 length:624 start_codon:yes stop_codon:yes gene_type:complete